LANGVPTVLTFRDILDAQAAAALLEAEGIECVLANEYLVGMAWTYSTAVGGVQLQVAPDRAEEALALLAADESSSLAELEADLPARKGDDACPRCGSEDVTLIRWSRYAAAAMLFVPLPLFIWRNRVKCRSCGNEWRSPDARRPQVRSRTERHAAAAVLGISTRQCSSSPQNDSMHPPTELIPSAMDPSLVTCP